MKKIFTAIVFILSIIPFFAYAQTQQSLDDAVQGGSRYLQERFPKGTRAAIIVVKSESPELSELVNRKLGAVLVNSGWFTVVERDAAALETLALEMDRHLNFEVSQETELSIGKRLGAQIIVSGGMARSGQNWRLDLHAVWIESAQRAGQWTAENIRPDPVWASLASPRSAGISFTGDALSARDRQTLINGLRNAMQNRNVSLELDENSSSAFSFALTIYRTQLPPSPPANAALLKAEVTVNFSQAGRILCQTGPYDITEMNDTLLFRRISDRLAADQAFFGKVNAAIK